MWTYFVMMFGAKKPNYEQAHVRLKVVILMPTDCSVLCTLTILSNIRISWELSHFYAHIGAGSKFFTLASYNFILAQIKKKITL